MGRIIETYPANDGIVRSAMVKTQDETLKRPGVKLAPVFYEGVFTTEKRVGDVGAHYSATLREYCQPQMGNTATQNVNIGCGGG